MTFNGLTNHVVPIPGSTATVYLGVHNRTPHIWHYSIWDEGDSLISTGSLDLSPLTPTPEQVGRIAFLLDVDQQPPVKISH